ncbi:MAG: XdhC family protein [Spirochaetia bacterium]
MTDKEIFHTLLLFRKRGTAACLATIVETHGSTPREIGAKMIVCADGTTYGSVGGGCGESNVRRAALRCLITTGKPERMEVNLMDDLGTKDGDVCGGKMGIFLEPFNVSK